MKKERKSFYVTENEYFDLRQVLEMIRSEKTNISYSAGLNNGDTLVVMKRPTTSEDCIV